MVFPLFGQLSTVKMKKTLKIANKEYYLPLRGIYMSRGSTRKKLGPKTDPSQKYGNLKMDLFQIQDLKTEPSQKSETLKWTINSKIIF